MKQTIEIQQDANGKWFCYFSETKEYTPGFTDKKSLIKFLESRGYCVKGDA